MVCGSGARAAAGVDRRVTVCARRAGVTFHGERRRRRDRVDGGGVDADLRASVLRRAMFACEVRLDGCTLTARVGVHHRKPRGRGGLDTYENLVAVCDNCHTGSPRAIHRQPAWATEEGLLVPSWEPTPTTVWHPRVR